MSMKSLVTQRKNIIYTIKRNSFNSSVSYTPPSTPNYSVSKFFLNKIFEKRNLHCSKQKALKVEVQVHKEIKTKKTKTVKTHISIRLSNS